MKSENTPSPSGPKPTTLENLPVSALPAAERSRAIREMVSIAMEDLDEVSPLSPMPIAGLTAEARIRQQPPSLAPLPTKSAPFQTLD